MYYTNDDSSFGMFFHASKPLLNSFAEIPMAKMKYYDLMVIFVSVPTYQETAQEVALEPALEPVPESEPEPPGLIAVRSALVRLCRSSGSDEFDISVSSTTMNFLRMT